MKKLMIGLSFLLLVTTISASDIQIQCDNHIDSWGNLKKIHAKDFSANILFKNIKLNKNAIGYGPGKNRQYEVSILDGRIYMARPAPNNKTLLRHNPTDSDGAAMLQVANVKKWGIYKELDNIDSQDALNFELDDIVSELGCKKKFVLPFKIIGHAKSVTWSMDTDNRRVDTIKNVNIVLEGLYAKNKEMRVKHFMVKGTNTHTHVILPQKDLAGHLQDIILDTGAKLYLPIKKGA